MLLHTVSHSAIQMFPPFVRPQSLAGGETMKGNATVAYVHKAQAWLVTGTRSPRWHGGMFFLLKQPQCTNSEVGSNIIFYVVLCQETGILLFGLNRYSSTKGDGRRRGYRRIGSRAEPRAHRPGLGPREAGHSSPSVRRGNAAGRKGPAGEDC